MHKYKTSHWLTLSMSAISGSCINTPCCDDSIVRRRTRPVPCCATLRRSTARDAAAVGRVAARDARAIELPSWVQPPGESPPSFPFCTRVQRRNHHVCLAARRSTCCQSTWLPRRPLRAAVHGPVRKRQAQPLPVRRKPRQPPFGFPAKRPTEESAAPWIRRGSVGKKREGAQRRSATPATCTVSSPQPFPPVWCACEEHVS